MENIIIGASVMQCSDQVPFNFDIVDSRTQNVLMKRFRRFQRRP